MMTIEHQIEYYSMRRLDELEAAHERLVKDVAGGPMAGVDAEAKRVLEGAIRLRRVYERVGGLLG